MKTEFRHRDTVIETIKKIASEQNYALSSLSDDLPLQESGLDSLCWAIVVARLEERLGFDPFTAQDDVVFPLTLGDFIRAYDSAATK